MHNNCNMKRTRNLFHHEPIHMLNISLYIHIYSRLKTSTRKSSTCYHHHSSTGFIQMLLGSQLIKCWAWTAKNGLQESLPKTTQITYLPYVRLAPHHCRPTMDSHLSFSPGPLEKPGNFRDSWIKYVRSKNNCARKLVEFKLEGRILWSLWSKVTNKFHVVYTIWKRHKSTECIYTNIYVICRYVH